MRPLSEIIVHCAATRPDWLQGQHIATKVDAIRRWHTDPKPKGNGWRDIGYHFVIDRDGTIATGRPLDQVGAHVQGHNTGTIGICLLGGHGSSERDQFEEHFTTAQDRALRKLIDELVKAHGPMNLSGHNQYAPKACPGFHVPTWYARDPVKPVDYVQPVKGAKAQPEKPTIWTLIADLLARLFGGKK